MTTSKQLSIATICWARNEEEEEQLRTSLHLLSQLNIPVFITDGGSGDSFKEFVQSLANITLLEATGKGVQAQARNSVKAAYASDTSLILYTEPDKAAFFQTGLPLLLDGFQPARDFGIQLAARSAAGFASFPPFQQMTETTINNCCTEVTGKPLDYTYGPFLLKRELVPFLDHLKEDVGWGWRPYLFILAHRSGLSVKASVSDFYCPPDQREDDAGERIYRMRQLEQNIRGIVLATQVPL
jgi:hypothetical protein